MSKNEPAVSSWELMGEFREALGAKGLQKIFSVGNTQISRYCRNPEYAGSDAERNPIDRMRILLRDANEAGASSAVRIALDEIMKPLGLRVAYIENPEPDQPTTEEELLSDYRSLGVVQNLMKVEKAHPSVVRPYVDRAKEDIEQSFTSYSRDFERGLN